MYSLELSTNIERVAALLRVELDAPGGSDGLKLRSGVFGGETFEQGREGGGEAVVGLS
jgi:hypothetical protein